MSGLSVPDVDRIDEFIAYVEFCKLHGCVPKGTFEAFERACPGCDCNLEEGAHACMCFRTLQIHSARGPTSTQKVVG